MTNQPSWTALQRIALLLLNVPSTDRPAVLERLRAGDGGLPQPAAKQVTGRQVPGELVIRACRRVIEELDDPDEAQHILRHVPEVTELLEQQRAASEQEQFAATVVGTIPEYFYDATEDAIPPINHGSLEAEVTRIARSARERLDICVPYVSHSGVDILTAGLTPDSRKGLEVRVLTLATSQYSEQNKPGVIRLIKKFRQAGATVEVRSPTDGEAKRTGAVAVMHAKILVADQKRGYLGTANISRAAFLRGFEVGMIVEGRLAKNLCHLNDWVFTRHQPLQIDERELLPRTRVQRVQKRDSEAWLGRAAHSAHREVQAPPP